MTMLKSALKEAVSQIYSEDLATQLPAHAYLFYPYPNSYRGDLSSKIAIELAARLRTPTQQVAEKLIEFLQPRCGGEWWEEAGYTVVRGLDREWWSAELCEMNGEDSRVAAPEIIFASGNNQPFYAQVRCAAVAFLHQLISQKRKAEFPIPPQPFSVFTVQNSAGVDYSLSTHLNRLTGKLLEESLAISPRTFIWTTRSTFETLSKPERALASALRKKGVWVMIPPDGWLISRARVAQELLHQDTITALLGRLSHREDWLRFVFHAASTLPSTEYDPAVALFDELSSPLWSIRELAARMNKICPEEILVQDCHVLANLDDLGEGCPSGLRVLWLASALQPARMNYASLTGEILPWMDTVQVLSGMGHAFLNNPDLRIRLKMGKTSAAERKIIAGLNFGVSSILNSV